MPIFATTAIAAIAATVGLTSIKGGSKKQAASPSKKTPSSPIKKELTTMTITTKKKMSKTPYSCKVLGFQGDFAMVWCEKGYQPGQDAYTHPFQIAVKETVDFREHGYLAVVNRRVHGAEESTMALNSQDGYPRKIFICYLQENNHAARMGLLTVMKEFMEQAEHNRFSYAYTVNDESDVTPPNDQLESMDTFMLDQQLVGLMQQVFDGADQSFFQANASIANNFFAGPTYPQCAIDALGYPGASSNN